MVIDGLLLFHDAQVVVHFIVVSSLGPHGSACRIRRTVQFCFELPRERGSRIQELACGFGRVRLIVLTCAVEDALTNVRDSIFRTTIRGFCAVTKNRV